MSEQPLELAKMLTQLRKELKQAQTSAKDEDLQFNLTDIEVEVQFTVSNKSKKEGGLKFYVNAGMSKEKTSQAVHTVRLKMNPIQGGQSEAEGGKPLLISDEVDEMPE